MIVRSPLAPAVPLAAPERLAPVGTAEAPRPHWPGRELVLGGDGAGVDGTGADAGAATRLHVRETPGPDDTDETAVFVHGLGGSSTNWTELAGALSRCWHGVAPDLPGFGASPPPPGGDYRPAAHAVAVTALLEHTAARRGGPVHLLGNSLGGAVALLAAAARPDLVRTLTLVSPAMPDLRPSPSRLGDAQMVKAAVPVLGVRARTALATEDPRTRLARTMRLCWADPATVSPAAFELAVAEAARRATVPWAAEAMQRSFIGLVRTWLAPRSRSLWAAAGRVPVPTLVVWGEVDRLVSVRRARRTAASFPDARLMRLPGVGHVAQMERPQLVGRAVLALADAAAGATLPVPRLAEPSVMARTIADAAPGGRQGYGTVPV